jgi:hypothetical protein
MAGPLFKLVEHSALDDLFNCMFDEIFNSRAGLRFVEIQDSHFA